LVHQARRDEQNHHDSRSSPRQAEARQVGSASARSEGGALRGLRGGASSFSNSPLRTTARAKGGARSRTTWGAERRPDGDLLRTGTDLARLESSPQLEGFRARGIEVLLLPDAVDSFWVTAGMDYEGKPFKSVTQAARTWRSFLCSSQRAKATRQRPRPSPVCRLESRPYLGTKSLMCGSRSG
jgi:hypothetical protein